MSSVYDDKYADMIDALLGMFWCSYMEHVLEDKSDMTFKEWLSSVVVEHQKETAEDVLKDCLLRAPDLVPPTARRWP